MSYRFGNIAVCFYISAKNLESFNEILPYYISKSRGLTDSFCSISESCCNKKGSVAPSFLFVPTITTAPHLKYSPPIMLFHFSLFFFQHDQYRSPCGQLTADHDIPAQGIFSGRVGIEVIILRHTTVCIVRRFINIPR